MSGARPTVFLLTDFGSTDQYVAVMKAVILSRCPDVQFVDITHEVAPQAVDQGAYLLESIWQWLPEESIVLAVVDPGVGSEREPAVFSHDGKCIVGPNNGLFGFLPPALEGRVLDRPKFWLDKVSATFHGRDIFAPCVAHLASGEHWARLGSALTVPVQRQFSQSAIPGASSGTIIHFDHFGSAITSIRAAANEISGKGVLLPAGKEVPIRQTYSSVESGQPVAYVGSTGRIELAVRNGNAQMSFKLQIGDSVKIVSTDTQS